MIRATRYHDFSCGHRVVGHEGKCRHLHGHNYRVHFHCAPDMQVSNNSDALDAVGRVLDFSVMKSVLCEWLEKHWDHKMLLWTNDQDMRLAMLSAGEDNAVLAESVVWVPFNPTAENMARYLCAKANDLLDLSGVTCVRVDVEETRKCSATYELGA